MPEETQRPRDADEPDRRDEPEIPAEPPPREKGGEAAIPDRPMGVQGGEEEPADALPGIPEREPPTSG